MQGSLVIQQPYQQILLAGVMSSSQLVAELVKCLSTELNEGVRGNIETEINCFKFGWKNGVLVPWVQHTSGDGNSFSHPDLTTFSEPEWSYIESRLLQNEHPFLNARYGHLLWMHTRHNGFALKAITYYKALAVLYLEGAIQGKKWFHKFGKVVQCYHQICVTTNQHLQECKTDIQHWVNNQDIPLWCQCYLLEIILESRLFKQQNLTGMTELMLSRFNAGTFYYSEAVAFLTALLPLAQKEKVGAKEILSLLGENEVRAAIKRADDETGIVPRMCLQRAAGYIQRAGNPDRYNEIMSMLTEQKYSLRLTRVPITFSGPELQANEKHQSDLVDKLLAGNWYDGFLYLATSKSFIPPADQSTGSWDPLESTCRHASLSIL